MKRLLRHERPISALPGRVLFPLCQNTIRFTTQVATMKHDRVRHELILGRLSTDQRIGVAETAEELGVSMETIRRDLKLLEERGHLRRIHGGALPPTAQQDRPLHERSRIAAREKAQLAALVLPMLQTGMSVFLDTGTTTLAVARELAAAPPLVVFTNSLDIALLVSRSPQHTVHVTGGTLRTNDNALVGYDALATARKYAFDLALLGIAAIDEEGFLDFADDEAELRRVLARQSRKIAILAEHSKFGRNARIRTFYFRDVQALVTDRAPPPPFAEAMQAAGMEIVHG
jgi:DeoR family transcriptional regulator, glycerol-3-phosphate regulon repressor